MENVELPVDAEALGVVSPWLVSRMGGIEGALLVIDTGDWVFVIH